jgi:hypothetical protein
VPVTVRTTVPIGETGGTFAGVLTGGNGRAGAPAATNSYEFNVPGGQKDLDVSVALANDPGDFFIAELVDPNGQTVGYTSNVTTDTSGNPMVGLTADLYKVNPMAGQWSLVLDWQNPVTGFELSEPFTGTVQFNHVDVTNNLPNGPTKIASGTSQTFNVNVTNTGTATEGFWVDPRLNQNETISLPDQNGSPTNMSLPLPGGLSFPVYIVPSQTTQLQASLTGSAPVTFDLEPFPGDPDLAPGVNLRPTTSGSINGDNASLTFNEPEVSPGFWYLNPAEIGPFPSTGAPTVTASANLNAVTQAFDPTMTSPTGDLWSSENGLSSGFKPLYLAPGDSTTITVTVSPTGPPGTQVSGTLFVDDFDLSTEYVGAGVFNSDELAAIPYSYTISH